MGSWLKSLLLSTIAVLMPIKSVILAAMVLCFADLVLGVVVAKKKSQPITSKGLSRTIVKMLVYEVAIVFGFVAETYLIQGALPIVKMIGLLITATELKSILENLDILSGNNLFQSIIDKLGSQSDKEQK